ncbi:MAG: GNAT family N-acetyltransferase [Haloarculaceae archaeon]
MPGPVFLKGEQVRLNPVEEEDLAFLLECINDPRVRRGIASYRPTNREQEAEWFEGIAESDDEEHFLLTAAGDRAGIVGLHDVDEVFGNAEIGYYVHPEHWGNGYATDAVRQVAAYAFEERRLHRVSAKCFADNDASRRVLEKVGFEREGTLREGAFVRGEYVDLYQYGLLEDEWDGRP